MRCVEPPERFTYNNSVGNGYIEVKETILVTCSSGDSYHSTCHLEDGRAEWRPPATCGNVLLYSKLRTSELVHEF